ncbi:hypothetical protein HBI70_088530 [Parastagonospora nodorum]|nr:hypothetical protein HBH50_097540 [Parastagonospora nodorum]KAH4090904.1 hypothetical protein HBH48_101310 [Parastagonospora nodorum]KAH4260546.1 hypothetical protein HBI03_127110 [Parastagonospora nodorum]KAH4267957.1 hypothetical protein HBI04_167030 [Parastagonospora nodorum]KAH4606014.1 hypothetical protein HBH82_116150 [Parastagonospora nodorum]
MTPPLRQLHGNIITFTKSSLDIHDYNYHTSFRIFTHTTSPNNSTLPPPQTAIMKRNVVIFLIILILFILIAAIAYLIYYLQTRMAVGGTASSVSDMTEP